MAFVTALRDAWDFIFREEGLKGIPDGRKGTCQASEEGKNKAYVRI